MLVWTGRLLVRLLYLCIDLLSSFVSAGLRVQATLLSMLHKANAALDNFLFSQAYSLNKSLLEPSTFVLALFTSFVE